jgi:hypothetical protein
MDKVGGKVEENAVKRHAICHFKQISILCFVDERKQLLT